MPAHYCSPPGLVATATLATLIAAAGPAQADDLVLLVAPEGTATPAAPARPRQPVVGVASFDVALARAARHLADCGACVVTIKLGAGLHAGAGGGSAWTLPATKAPQATLRILGGYDDVFRRRTPLTTPSVLVVTAKRTGAVLGLSRGTALRELHYSGLAIDAGPANRYDDASRSLMRGRSPSGPLLAFDGLTVDRLIVADSLFLNAPAGVAAPVVTPASAKAEIIVRNNVFANDVLAWQVKGTSTKPLLARYLIDGNSFVLNFPATADTTTSNPGALELGGKSTAARVEITRNLFAYNVGGAVVRQWDEPRTPPVALTGNLFWRNGELFEPTDPGHGAVIGRSGTSTTLATPDEVAALSSWTIRGNTVADPGVAMPVARLVAHGQTAKAGADGDAASAAGTTPAGEFDFGDVFAPAEAIEVDATIAPADYADEGVVKNFAPRMPFNLAALPVAHAAGGHGASAAKVVTP